MIEIKNYFQMIIFFLVLSFIFKRFFWVEIFLFLLIFFFLLFLIFLPKKLEIFKKVFNYTFYLVSLFLTFIIVGFIYYFIFPLFKPILYLADKRFYRKVDFNTKTYYNKKDNDGIDIMEPF